MSFIQFLQKLPGDKKLTEAVAQAYKIIFEYQTDMFRSDDESKAIDKQQDIEFRIKEELQDYIDYEVDANDFQSFSGYLDDIRTNAKLVAEIILKKFGKECKIIPLIDNTTMLINDNHFYVFNDAGNRYLMGGGVESDLPRRIAESPEDFTPKSLPQIANYEDNFNNEFWENPPSLYHATPDENVEDIQEDGIFGTSGTGLGNRSVSGVFTSTEPTDIDSYGNNVFEINTDAMKQDGYTPFVGQEPDIEKDEKIKSIMHAFGLSDRDAPYDIESGMSATTIIVHGKIPPQYLTLT